MSKLQYKEDYEDEDDQEDDLEQSYDSHYVSNEEQNNDQHVNLSDAEFFELAEDNLNTCLHEMGLPTHFEQITAFDNYINKLHVGFGGMTLLTLLLFVPLSKALGPAMLFSLIFSKLHTKFMIYGKDIFDTLPNYKILKGNFFSRKNNIRKALENKDNFYSILYYINIIQYTYEKFSPQNDNTINLLKNIELCKEFFNDAFIKKDYVKLNDCFCKTIYPMIEKFQTSKAYGKFILEKDFCEYSKNIEGQFKNNKNLQTLHNEERKPNFENIVSFLVKGKK